MKYFSEFSFGIDASEIQAKLDEIRSGMTGSPDRQVLKTIFGLIDLTSLSEMDNAENITKMCEQVNLLDESYPDIPPPAAVCVYPELVEIARNSLTNPLVNLASVGAGFPSSQTFLAVKMLEIELAIQAGAEEIDIVMPVGKFLNGQYQEVFDEIREIKEQLGTLHLKVILESGVLPDLTLVQRASILALEAGADFIKTSTGKAASGATPEAFLVMCSAIRDFYGKTGKKAGIKPAGGISDAETAYLYYSIVNHMLGEEWLNAEKFRIGASRLANNLIRIIYDKDENFNYF